MRNLADMMDVVRHQLLKSNMGIINERFIRTGPKHALGFFHTESGNFLVKWNREFKMAGSIIRNLNGGKSAPGQTIPMDVYNDMIIKEPTVLFNTPESPIIYAISYDEFTRLSEPYTQESGEEVRVILSKSLTPWVPETQMPFNDIL